MTRASAPDDPLPSDRLIESAKAGSSAALEELSRLTRAFARQVGLGGGPFGATDVDGEDVARESLRKALATGHARQRGPGSEKSYLYGVVKATKLEMTRRARRRGPARASALENVAAPRAPGQRVDALKILSLLSRECRDLIERACIDGDSYPEMARELNVAESEVRSQLGHCLRRARLIATGRGAETGDHVVDRMADFLEGRLDEASVQELRRHLDECGECAADVAWVREFRSQAAAQGFRHLTPERIVTLASSEPAATPEEQAHLADCASCRTETEWARRQAPVDRVLAQMDREARRIEEPPAPAMPEIRVRPRVSRGWWWGAAAVAAAALVAILFFPRKHEAPPEPEPVPQPAPAPTRVEPRDEPRVEPLAALARVTPLPVRSTGGSGAPGSFEEARFLGLEAYRARSYNAAADYLRQALDMKPRSEEMRLYLGSAELLRGNPSAALPLLETVTVQSDDRTVLAETLWQLANAWLLVENREGALDALQRLKQLGGAHRADADSLRSRLEAMPPP